MPGDPTGNDHEHRDVERSGCGQQPGLHRRDADVCHFGHAVERGHELGLAQPRVSGDLHGHGHGPERRPDACWHGDLDGVRPFGEPQLHELGIDDLVGFRPNHRPPLRAPSRRQARGRIRRRQASPLTAFYTASTSNADTFSVFAVAAPQSNVVTNIASPTLGGQVTFTDTITGQTGEAAPTGTVTWTVTHPVRQHVVCELDGAVGIGQRRHRYLRDRVANRWAVTRLRPPTAATRTTPAIRATLTVSPSLRRRPRWSSRTARPVPVPGRTSPLRPR